MYCGPLKVKMLAASWWGQSLLPMLELGWLGQRRGNSLLPDTVPGAMGTAVAGTNRKHK